VPDVTSKGDSNFLVRGLTGCQCTVLVMPQCTTYAQYLSIPALRDSDTMSTNTERNYEKENLRVDQLDCRTVANSPDLRTNGIVLDY